MFVCGWCFIIEKKIVCTLVYTTRGYYALILMQFIYLENNKFITFYFLVSILLISQQLIKIIYNINKHKYV